MHKILVIRLYFTLDALHVSNSVSPSSGANFYKLYIAFGICRYHTSGFVWLQPHNSQTPDDGLTEFETRRASNVK